MTSFNPFRRAEEAIENFFHPDVCLPQDSRDPQKRIEELAKAQRTYSFNYENVAPLAIAGNVPIRDEFSFKWLEIVAERVVTGLANRAKVAHDARTSEEHESFLGKLKGHIAGTRADGIRQTVREALTFEHRNPNDGRHASSIDDYAELFRTIGLPPVSQAVRNDGHFANQRVAGPNPVVIRRMTTPDERLPITDAMFAQAVPGDSLEAAFAEARLYLADYSILDGAEMGTFPHGQKYLYAPLALFVVDRKSRCRAALPSSD